MLVDALIKMLIVHKNRYAFILLLQIWVDKTDSMQPSLMTDKSQCHSQVWVDKKEADKSIDRQIMMFKVKSRDIEDMHIWLGLLEQDANRQVL